MSDESKTEGCTTCGGDFGDQLRAPAPYKVVLADGTELYGYESLDAAFATVKSYGGHVEGPDGIVDIPAEEVPVEPEAPIVEPVPADEPAKTPKGSKKAAEPVVVVALADQAAADELAALQAEIDALEA